MRLTFFTQNSPNVASELEAGEQLVDLEEPLHLYSKAALEKAYHLLINIKKCSDIAYANTLANGLSRQRVRKHAANIANLLCKAMLPLGTVGTLSLAGYLIYLTTYSNSENTEYQNYLFILSNEINIIVTNWTSAPIFNNPFNVSNYTCNNTCSETPTLTSELETIYLDSRQSISVNNYTISGCVAELFNCTYDWATSACFPIWNQLCNNYASYKATAKSVDSSGLHTFIFGFLSGISGLGGIFMAVKSVTTFIKLPKFIRKHFSYDYLHRGFIIPAKPDIDLKKFTPTEDYPFVIKILDRIHYGHLKTHADLEKAIKRLEKLIQNFELNETMHAFLSGAHEKSKGTLIHQFFRVDKNHQIRKNIIEFVLGRPLDQEQITLFAKKS